ncbi:MAG: YezD family protein [Candidatus Omnitrophota bacterium]
MSINKNSAKVINDTIIKDLSEAVSSLDYGTVTIKVHDAKISQIEIAKRKRFDDIWSEEGGGI